jgi:hypothetical protein
MQATSLALIATQSASASTTTSPKSRTWTRPKASRKTVTLFTRLAAAL